MQPAEKKAPSALSNRGAGGFHVRQAFQPDGQPDRLTYYFLPFFAAVLGKASASVSYSILFVPESS
jgi:hypothetical protein